MVPRDLIAAVGSGERVAFANGAARVSKLPQFRAARLGVTRSRSGVEVFIFIQNVQRDFEMILSAFDDNAHQCPAARTSQ